MKVDTNVDHFEEATDFASREARIHILDGLACVFHNEGYGLEGNTEANDAEWLANQIAHELKDNRLDRLDEESRELCRKLSRIAIKLLPDLANRISSRYIRISKALRTMEKVTHAQHMAAKKVAR